LALTSVAILDIPAPRPVRYRCFGGVDLAKPEWGIKRVCQSCATLFYDFDKSPIICPSCGSPFDPEAVLKSRRNRAPVAEDPKTVRAKAKSEDEDDEDTDLDDEDEDDVLDDEDDNEIIPDLDEDDPESALAKKAGSVGVDVDDEDEDEDEDLDDEDLLEDDDDLPPEDDEEET
jgi:hypothetical protein